MFYDLFWIQGSWLHKIHLTPSPTPRRLLLLSGLFLSHTPELPGLLETGGILPRDSDSYLT